MALSKDIIAPFGLPATYHRIQSVQVYYQERCCDVSIYGYASEQMRRDGIDPMITPSIRFTFDELGADDAPTRDAIYAKIKQMPEFSGATDC